MECQGRLVCDSAVRPLGGSGIEEASPRTVKVFDVTVKGSEVMQQPDLRKWDNAPVPD